MFQCRGDAKALYGKVISKLPLTWALGCPRHEIKLSHQANGTVVIIKTAYAEVTTGGQLKSLWRADRIDEV